MRKATLSNHESLSCNYLLGTVFLYVNSMLPEQYVTSMYFAGSKFQLSFP